MFNMLIFTKVPITHLIAEDEKGLTVKELLSPKAFWIMMLLMVCAGASEQAVSQWAPTFSEIIVNYILMVKLKLECQFRNKMEDRGPYSLKR